MSRNRHGVKRLGPRKRLETDPRLEQPKPKLEPLPPRPAWLADDETWSQLLEMRRKL